MAEYDCLRCYDAEYDNCMSSVKASSEFALSLLFVGGRKGCRSTLDNSGTRAKNINLRNNRLKSARLLVHDGVYRLVVVHPFHPHALNRRFAVLVLKERSSSG